MNWREWSVFVVERKWTQRKFLLKQFIIMMKICTNKISCYTVFGWFSFASTFSLVFCLFHLRNAHFLRCNISLCPLCHFEKEWRGASSLCQGGETQRQLPSISVREPITINLYIWHFWHVVWRWYMQVLGYVSCSYVSLPLSTWTKHYFWGLASALFSQES